MIGTEKNAAMNDKKGKYTFEVAKVLTPETVKNERPFTVTFRKNGALLFSPSYEKLQQKAFTHVELLVAKDNSIYFRFTPESSGFPIVKYGNAYGFMQKGLLDEVKKAKHDVGKHRLNRLDEEAEEIWYLHPAQFE